MTYKDISIYHPSGGVLSRRGFANLSSQPTKAGYANFLDEQFNTGSLNSSRWLAYDASNGNATYGAPTRIQTYKASNVIVGAGTVGATGGTSCKMVSTETDNGSSGTLPTPGAPGTGSAGTRYAYGAGMFDSKSANFYLPLYHYAELRCKIPHGQGLWAAPWWLTAKNGGANMVEFDGIEYFHSQIPGKVSVTLHSATSSSSGLITSRFTNNGASGNGAGRTFFETPTYTPAFNLWGFEILPVTDSTGNTLGDPTKPTSYLRYTTYLNGVLKYQFVDTLANYYTTNGGSVDSFWNLYSQGCQIDGNYVGHPRDALGYSHWLNQCLISGSPGSCAISTGGYTVQRAQFDGVANVTELDYIRVWKYTG